VKAKTQNLKPWKPGQSGNPGGRPKKKLVTDELEWLLEQEAPRASGKTWAAVIAEALLRKARKGDVRAIAELANRVEGKTLQQLAGPEGGPIPMANITAADLTDDEIAAILLRNR
jgi:hypothetical protein